MVSFGKQREEFIKFLEGSYKSFLPSNLSEKNIEIVDDFLDFDKYKNDFTLFIDFSRISFPFSKYSNDCGGETENLEATVYIVRRNDKSGVLKSDVLEMCYAFYEMVKEDNTLGVALNTVISEINFYNYVEGNKNLACGEISLSLTI
jgi:hypothetical protein